MTFLDELYLVGTLTDPHLDEYDGTEYDQQETGQ